MPGSCFSARHSVAGLGDFGLPGRLTFCTSEGTLDRKSTTSLLSMLYGFRNFLVNLLMPKTEIHTQRIINASLLWLRSLFPHKQIPAEEAHAVREILLLQPLFFFYFHFLGCNTFNTIKICLNSFSTL